MDKVGVPRGRRLRETRPGIGEDSVSVGIPRSVSYEKPDRERSNEAAFLRKRTQCQMCRQEEVNPAQFLSSRRRRRMHILSTRLLSCQPGGGRAPVTLRSTVCRDYQTNPITARCRSGRLRPDDQTNTETGNCANEPNPLVPVPQGLARPRAERGGACDPAEVRGYDTHMPCAADVHIGRESPCKITCKLMEIAPWSTVSIGQSVRKLRGNVNEAVGQ